MDPGSVAYYRFLRFALSIDQKDRFLVIKKFEVKGGGGGGRGRGCFGS